MYRPSGRGDSAEQRSCIGTHVNPLRAIAGPVEWLQRLLYNLSCFLCLTVSFYLRRLTVTSDIRDRLTFSFGRFRCFLRCRYTESAEHSFPPLSSPFINRTCSNYHINAIFLLSPISHDIWVKKYHYAAFTKAPTFTSW